MRKIFYSVLFLACSTAAYAQTVRKIPFLPYLQSGNGGTLSSDAVPFQSNQAPSMRKVATIYFNPNETHVSRKDLGTLQSVVAQARQQGADIFTYSYRASDLKVPLPEQRLESVGGALREIDPHIAVYPTVFQRDKPIITPHRVEIFLK